MRVVLHLTWITPGKVDGGVTLKWYRYCLNIYTHTQLTETPLFKKFYSHTSATTLTIAATTITTSATNLNHSATTLTIATTPHCFNPHLHHKFSNSLSNNHLSTQTSYTKCSQSHVEKKSLTILTWSYA